MRPELSADQLDDRELHESSTLDDAGSTPADIEELFTDLVGVRDDTESQAAREEVLEIKQLLAAAHDRGLIDSGVRGLRASDAAEAFVGSVVFASPLLVEDGVFDIADFLFGFTVSSIPVFLIANTLFVVVMTYALLEWTGRDTQETKLLFGRIPIRVIMILAVSFLVATILMTVWGRVGGWSSPTEAIARINVIWTVGALGAALGDILSHTDSEPAVTLPNASGQHRAGTTAAERDADGTDSSLDALTDGDIVTALHERFDKLETVVDDRDERREVQRIRERATDATLDDGLGEKIRKYTSRDVAEAFVGSIFFSIPFLVEDGVFDVAEYFLAFRIGGFPVFFLVNAAFVILIVAALVYWTGPQDVEVSRPLFGFVPRRLVGIAVVSFLTAAALMTMWGRVGNWQEPVVALARISAVWTVASFGAALGDILPGESSGDDINDDLAELAQFDGGTDDAADPRR